MPILHFCEQYSDDYDQLRLGIPTSSSFDKIITPGGKPSKQWKKYAFHLIAERCLQRKVDSYTSEWMERGLVLEQAAAEFYHMMKGAEPKLIGFITNDEGTIGCSPDRLLGDDGLIEIKCPMPQTQIEYLLTGEIDKDYWPQLQGQLFVSGRQFVDIISYHPELPPSIIRVERDEVFIACLESLLQEFNDFVTKAMDKIISVQNPEKGNTNERPEIRF